MVALDRAWRGLLTVLDVRASLVQEDPRVVDGAADAVAEFVAGHPGALEAHAGHQARELVRDWGGQRVAALFGEARDHERGRAYARMLAALSPDELVRAFAALWRFDHRVGELCDGRALEHLVRRAAPATLASLELPPEAYDALHALAGLAPLPDILPPDVASLAARDVVQLFEIYTGLGIAELEQRLRGGGRRGRFLGDGESLAPVILRDAQALARRHLDRHAVARALAARFDHASAERHVAPGHALDPFHTIDVYPVHGHGSDDLKVGWLRKRMIPSLAVETIRRAGLFAGADVGFVVRWLRLG